MCLCDAGHVQEKTDCYYGEEGRASKRVYGVDDEGGEGESDEAGAEAGTETGGKFRVVERIVDGLVFFSGTLWRIIIIISVAFGASWVDDLDVIFGRLFIALGIIFEGIIGWL